MVAVIVPPQEDHRIGIKGAKNVQTREAAWKRFLLIHHLRNKLRLRRIRKENDAILKDLDDATVSSITSRISVPKTLAEALPDDKTKDKRAIVVTEATGKFNMIGCNKVSFSSEPAQVFYIHPQNINLTLTAHPKSGVGEPLWIRGV